MEDLVAPALCHGTPFTRQPLLYIPVFALPRGVYTSRGKPCRHPEQLRHSLESVGFDVVAISRDLLGLELEWSKDGSLPKHLTLVTALMQP